MTYNTTTRYVLPFIDRAEGPWVIVMPEGEVRGAARKDGYTVVNLPTVNFLPGIRLMSKDPEDRRAILEKIEIYPYEERAHHPRGLTY